jgi:hypothetical protein
MNSLLLQRLRPLKLKLLFMGPSQHVKVIACSPHIGPVASELPVLNEVKRARVFLTKHDGHVFSVAVGRHNAKKWWHHALNSTGIRYLRIANLV